MKILGIIPARFESTRFPGKPLADIDGMPLIQRVYNQVSMSDYLDEVIIATDHPLIMPRTGFANGGDSIISQIRY